MTLGSKVRQLQLLEEMQPTAAFPQNDLNTECHLMHLESQNLRDRGRRNLQFQPGLDNKILSQNPNQRKDKENKGVRDSPPRFKQFKPFYNSTDLASWPADLTGSWEAL